MGMNSVSIDRSFRGTRKQYVERFIEVVNGRGEGVEIIHRQFTRFEQVNYLAVKDERGVVGAMVMLVDLDKATGELSHRLVDEEEHPAFHDANARTLSMLSPTEDEDARAWRADCVAAQAAAAARRKAGRVAAQHVDRPYRPAKRVSVKAKYAGCRLFVDHPALFARCLKAGVLH